MDELRTRRVAESLREELSELIRGELSDPRVEGVDVTEVVVSSDLRRADVLVSLPEGDEPAQEALAGLDRARHYLRRQLAQRLDLFRTPELHFVAAAELGGGAPLKRLLRRARRGRDTLEDPATSG
jgi:ribosome-binding factor A